MGQLYGPISRFEALNLSFQSTCKRKPLLEKQLRDAGSSMAFRSEVVMGVQPGPVVINYSNTTPGTWNSDLCDCCADMGVCLCGTFVPCILAAQVSQDFGESCCLPCLPGTILALRTGVRERYHIQGSICDDWVAMFCCGPCALCQLSRELSHRK